MADIEKISIGTTSYDVKDAKAFHNKSLADTSIVEEGSGTTTYPSNSVNNTNNVIIGKGAYVTNASARYSTVIGKDARFSYNNTASYYATSIGYVANCAQSYSTAIGAATYSYQYGTALGYGASTGSYVYCTALGSNARTAAGYSTAVGATATTKTSYDIAIGYGANITSTNGSSIQIGQGTNADGGFQVRTWKLLDKSGIIPIERIPTDLVVTTPEPLPNPEYCPLGTTQMYLGQDTDAFKKGHMYTVADDKNGHCVFIIDYDNTTFGNINSRQLINIVDKEKFYNKLISVRGTHGARPRNLTQAGMWNNSYMTLYYHPTTNEFQIGASYEPKVETLYYDYAYAPKVSRQVLLDDWGIELTTAFDNAPKPTYDNASLAYIVATSHFGVDGVSFPSYDNRFETWARIGYEEIKSFFSNPVDLGTSGMYTPKTGDKVYLYWIASSSFDPVAGGGWQMQLQKEDTYIYIITPPSKAMYWTTDELKAAWGIVDLAGKGLYNGRTYISGTAFTLVFNYGHKWTEASATVDQEFNPLSENAQSGVAVAQALQNKQDKLTAGANITIVDNVISATGGGSSLPPQTGHAGEFLTTDGTDASWAVATKITFMELS